MKVQIALDKPLGYRQIAAISVLKSLADGLAISGGGAGIPTDARYCVIQCDTQVVRWTDDGTVPTATKGMRIAAGGELTYAGDLAGLKFFPEAAGANLNIAFYRNA